MNINIKQISKVAVQIFYQDNVKYQTYLIFLSQT